MVWWRTSLWYKSKIFKSLDKMDLEVLLPILFTLTQFQYVSPAPMGILSETELKQKPFRCTSCPPGYGVVRSCSQSKDTLCKPCKVGFHSLTSSTEEACLPCSLCGKELFELHRCLPTRDVFCGLCTMPGVRKNKDYLRKCSGPQKTVNKDSLKYGKSSDKNAVYEMMGDDPQATILNENKNATEPNKDKIDTSKFMIIVENEETNETNPNPLISINSEADPKNSNKSTVDESNIKSKSPDSVQLLVNGSLPTENSTNENEHPDPEVANLANQATNIDQTIIDHNISYTVAKKDNTTNDITLPVDYNGQFINNQSEKVLEAELTTESNYDGHLEPSVERSTTREERPEEKMASTTKDIPSSKAESEDRLTTTDLYKTLSAISINKSEPEIVVLRPVDREKERTSDDELIGSSKNNDEDDVGASSKHEPVGAFALIIVVLTCAIIFFLLGFYFNRYHGSKMQMYSPHKQKNSYQLAPLVLDEGDEDDYLPKKTPKIVYTSDEVKEEKADTLLLRKKSTEIERELAGNTGKFQSPIDIIPEDAVFDDDLAKTPLVINYVPENTKSLINTGCTVKVSIDARGSDLHGGPLGETRFCLDHFHFHWGTEDHKGSEHTVTGSGFAAELHLVHWNKDLFKNFSDALKYKSGLCVIGVFLEASNEEHHGLQALLDVFNSIRYKGESCEVPHHFFDPGSLLPAHSTDYWTYPGSLTVPPYNESVQWILMKNPIKVSHRQLEKFRDLRKYEKGGSTSPTDEEERYIRDNYRCTMNIGDRILKASFH